MSRFKFAKISFWALDFLEVLQFSVLSRGWPKPASILLKYRFFLLSYDSCKSAQYLQTYTSISAIIYQFAHSFLITKRTLTLNFCLINSHKAIMSFYYQNSRNFFQTIFFSKTNYLRCFLRTHGLICDSILQFYCVVEDIYLNS